MTCLLACEAVSRSGSVALVDAGGRVVDFVASSTESAAAWLAPALARMVRTHGRPSALAVAQGPGPFTGLRIAVTAARTLAWMEDLPVHPVESLAALALAVGEGRWWVWLPLKRDTTYVGAYAVEGGRLSVLQPATAVLDEGPVPEVPAGVVVIGPALIAKPHLLPRWAAGLPVGPATDLDARLVARAVPAFPAVPWPEIQPDYRLASAPELQRAKGIS